MATISRRDFLAGLTAAGTAVLVRPLAYAQEKPSKVRKGSDLVTLGKSGVQTTLLGMGTGTNSGKGQRDMDQEKFTKMIRHALDRGIRYVDTADSYKTHPFVRKALEGVPRDRYFIQSKTFAKRPEAAKADLERFRRELNIETIDSLLMHCMMKGTWPADMRPVLEVLQEAKAKGQVRAIGISCHGLEPLAASVDAQGIDVQLARINPFGVEAKMDGTPEEVAPLLKKMHDMGRGIIGMKIFGESGFGSIEKRLQSLKYVLGLGCVDAFTIGFTSIEQFDETMELIEKASA